MRERLADIEIIGVGMQESGTCSNPHDAFSHSGDYFPKPVPEPSGTFVSANEFMVDANLIRLRRKIFTDGSCLKRAVGELCCAGWCSA